jgi:hypothetical protein
VPQGFFNTLNPFMHSEMQFKQHKITILFKFISPNFGQKTQKVEHLANAKEEVPPLTVSK